MKLTERQNKVLDLVKKMHKGQVRKYTNEPYWTHPYAVAEIVSEYNEDLIEVALCHDLFEDTNCTYRILFDYLQRIGYCVEESVVICEGVKDLTDVFTKSNFPDLPGEERSRLEAIRLSRISKESQTVKIADMIHNLSNIVELDPKFAETYIDEKIRVLSLLKKADRYISARLHRLILRNYKKM
jgi:(p)ppGpp synthase/HD superfamily hydrolase